MRRGTWRAAGAAAALADLLGLAAPAVIGQGFGEGGREGLIERLKKDLGLLGWRGRRDEGIRDPRAAARDLEERRIEREKEQRIGEARRNGAEALFGRHSLEVLRTLRERAARRRARRWRDGANPG